MSAKGLEKDLEILEPTKLIDQLVVNGAFENGARVTFRWLGLTAMGEAYRNDARFSAVVAGVVADDRFINRTEEGFSFRPDLSPGSTVTASWLSIIEGVGRFTGAEEYQFLLAMQAYTDAVYDNYKKIWTLHRDVVPTAELQDLIGMNKAILGQKGILPTDMRLRAFRRFISLPSNSWFTKLPDDRFVLLKTEHSTRPEDVPLLQPITDLQAAMQAAVEAIDPAVKISPKGVWRTLAEMGYYVTQRQRSKFTQCMQKIPGITRVSNTVYTYLPPTPPPKQAQEPPAAESPTEQPEPSLDAKIKQAGVSDSSSKKWSRRT